MRDKTYAISNNYLSRSQFCSSGFGRVALYSTYRQDNNITKDISDAWNDAQVKADNDAKAGFNLDVPEEADGILEGKGITRMFVNEVDTNFGE